MQKYKDTYCIYSDTDSVITSKPIEVGINNEIGGLKLEYTIKEGIFIRNKLYGFITDKGEEIVKASGYKKGEVKYNDLKEILLYKDFKKDIKTTRFYKNLENLNITIGEHTMQLNGEIVEKITPKYIDMTKNPIVIPRPEGGELQGGM